MMSTTNLTGHEAIAYAAEFGYDLTKAADPTEGARTVDLGEAREIAAEDPSLISIEVPKFDPTRMTASVAAVGSDGSSPVVWGLGTSNEMAFVDALLQDGFDADDAPFLRFVTCTAETQERVQHGDVWWDEDRNYAEVAGAEWAEREANALEGAPAGAWRGTPNDALPLVDGDNDLAEIANKVAERRWSELVQIDHHRGNIL